MGSGGIYSSTLGAEETLSELDIPIGAVVMGAEETFAEPGANVFDAVNRQGSDGTYSARKGPLWLEGKGRKPSQMKNLRVICWLCLSVLMRA